MKVLNKYKNEIPKDAVNIMRPSKFGNPFMIGVHGTRKEVVEKFTHYIYENPELMDKAKEELKGKSLVCCCKPLACHGDILLRIANED